MFNFEAGLAWTISGLLSNRAQHSSLAEMHQPPVTTAIGIILYSWQLPSIPNPSAHQRFPRQLSVLVIRRQVDIPGGTFARTGMFSMRIDGGETEMKFRRVYRLLRQRNYPVLLTDAKAMSLTHLNRLVQSKGVLLAVCSADYGEMEVPDPSKRSSYEELQFAWDRDIEILPLRLRDDWPPRATFGPEHPYDKDGKADALLAATIPPSKIYVECREKSENWIAAQIAKKLRGP